MIKQKHHGIDLSSINFKSMKGSDKPNLDDCSGVSGSSKPMAALDSSDSSDLPKNANIVDVDSS